MDRLSIPKDKTSTEPFSRINSDQSYQKTQCNDQPQQNRNLLLQNHRNRETKSTAHEDFGIVSIFRQCNRKLKNCIRIHGTIQTQPQDSNRNEWSKLQAYRQLHQHIEFFNLTS
jgi:hypothetical protein